MGKVLELKGQRFGRLTIIKRVENDKWKNAKWLCQCDCGNVKKINGYELKNGHTKSCGCLQKERASKARKTHGHKINRVVTKTYTAWQSMLKRCDNPKNKNYKDYGGRGIKVCDRWLHSFENFLSDIGKAPNGLTLDRKNNNGNYEPNNCRWVAMTEQNQNSRWAKLTPAIVRIMRYLANDPQFTMSDLAYAFNVSISCVEKAISRKTWANID